MKVSHLTRLLRELRLRIGNEVFEIEFAETTVRRERKEAPCEMTSCLSSGR